MNYGRLRDFHLSSLAQTTAGDPRGTDPHYPWRVPYYAEPNIRYRGAPVNLRAHALPYVHERVRTRSRSSASSASSSRTSEAWSSEASRSRYREHLEMRPGRVRSSSDHELGACAGASSRVSQGVSPSSARSVPSCLDGRSYWGRRGAVPQLRGGQWLWALPIAPPAGLQ